MTSPVRQRDRQAILNALRAGVPPSRGLEHIQVGLGAEVETLIADIRNVKDGGTAVRFVMGDYGSGKSFFLQVVRHAAQLAKCVTVNADITQNARLYGTGGKARALFSSLVASMGTKSQPDGGALAEVLEAFAERAQEEASLAGADIERIARERLADVRGFQGGYEFGEVILAYVRASRNGDDARREAALRWLRAEFRTKGEAKAALGVNGIIGDADFYPAMRLLAVLIRKAGYGGLVVEIDELAVLSRCNKAMRDQNYEQILTIVNDLLSGRPEGLAVVFAGTPEFVDNPTRGLASYSALQQRLSRNQFARPGLQDVRQPVLSLQALGPEDLLVLLGNVHTVYCSNGQRDPLPDLAVIHGFIEHAANQLGGLAHVSPREATRSFIQFLEILDQNRKQEWRELLDGITVSADTPSVDDGEFDDELAALVGSVGPYGDELAHFAV
jgi:P-loop Domain of unknown function (DUF2791)